MVSKLSRAYGLYNDEELANNNKEDIKFQSSFELTGYITNTTILVEDGLFRFQSSFELTGYITSNSIKHSVEVS